MEYTYFWRLAKIFSGILQSFFYVFSFIRSYLFIFLTSWIFIPLLVFSLLRYSIVTRYCVTLFSNTRFSPPLTSPKDKDQLKIILTWGSPDRIKFPLPSRNTLEARIFFKKLFRQLKHEIRSCLKILLFKKKRRLLAGTSIILNTSVTHLFQDSRG